jgi:hypothetical protein
VIRNPRGRSRQSNDLVLDNLRHDIINGENQDTKKLSGANLETLRAINYHSTELSDETSEIINNIIEEAD